MAIRERRKRIYRKRIPYGMQNFEGVSPVTMDDLTSGFDIGTNYSLAIIQQLVTKGFVTGNHLPLFSL